MQATRRRIHRTFAAAALAAAALAASTLAAAALAAAALSATSLAAAATTVAGTSAPVPRFEDEAPHGSHIHHRRLQRRTGGG